MDVWENSRKENEEMLAWTINFIFLSTPGNVLGRKCVEIVGLEHQPFYRLRRICRSK